MPTAAVIANRAIAHFDLDAFFVSVERRLDPSLESIPLIVGYEGKRGVVAACSYETRKFGVHSAMPMGKALRLCREAKVIPPNRAAYVKYSRLVTELLASEGLLLEKASIDEFYLDLSAKGDFSACYDFATRLRKEIIEATQLPISFALSVNKLVSKIAVDTVKPNGQTFVEPGTEEAFLAPMRIEKMPMIGKETAATLHKMGIFTLKQLAACSRDTLRTFLGNHGENLKDRAKGIDSTPVSQEHKNKSISTETTFDEDISDVAFLKKELARLNKRNARQLKESGYYAACAAIKMRFSDFKTVNRQMTVPPTTSGKELEHYILELFERYYVSGPFSGQRIRLIGVRYSGLLEDGFQLNLFSQDHQASKLDRIMEDLRAEFGNESIHRANEG